MDRRSITYIQVFFEAKTAAEIVKFQLQTNLKRQMNLTFEVPVWTGKTWVVWYWDEVGDAAAIFKNPKGDK